MSVPSNLDWLFTTLEWIVATAGVVLVSWCLFGDRARGRRRCPKCWYRMTGVPSLQCPECGAEAPREKALTRTRRRPRFAVAAAVVTLGALMFAIFGPPSPRWRHILPTLVLARIAPLSDQYLCTSWLDRELADRLRRGDTSALAQRWALDRYFVRYPAVLQDATYMRTRWPADAPMTAALSGFISLLDDGRGQSVFLRARLLSTNDGAPGPWVDSIYDGLFDKSLGAARAGPFVDLEVEIDRGADVLWTGRVRKTVLVGGRLDDVLAPVQSADLDKKIADWMAPRLVGWRGPPAAYVRDRSRDYVIGTDLAIGVTIEVLRDNEIVARGEHHWVPDAGGHCGNEPQGTYIPLRWSVEPPQVHSMEHRALEGRWAIRVRGEPVLALRDYPIGSFAVPAGYTEKTRVWAGSFEREVSSVGTPD